VPPGLVSIPVVKPVVVLVFFVLWILSMGIPFCCQTLSYSFNEYFPCHCFLLINNLLLSLYLIYVDSFKS
ncbi:MAG: hypothetical protein LBR15_05455, partial [Methanobrevibacter sp.]|nr:hypothetical protein [Candidatus Methanovirga australis]